jgi:integration host factor subunit beta
MTTTTTKKDLIDRIANETNQKRSAVKRTIQCFLDCVIRELSAGHRLEFRDFGVFEIRERAPRIAQNPKTLERVPVPAKKTVKFKLGRLMKMALDGELTEAAFWGDGEDEDEHAVSVRPGLRAR